MDTLYWFHFRHKELQHKAQQTTKSWGEKHLSLFTACVGVKQLTPFLPPFKIS